MMHPCIESDDASMHYKLQAHADNAGMHEATRTNIKALMAKNGVPSERQLAIDCGMSQSTLNRFLSGETDSLDFARLIAIAHFFEVSVSQLVGETPLEEDPKIRAVVLAMQQMPEYKKDALVAASHSLAEPEIPPIRNGSKR